ncbi:hypothetical protein [Brevundimonas goettingensis]|uniref:Uncharacterized protein n=1 Tax=Brevundimonas goettingensis TaxID=2774190 RepID=A0A975C4H2_9CAUL|nr:hypothetical protein [Brevundimonas goettingensis]QTC92717.1 hypothetical protein IFJ75_07620 [Brevundimonas goettingensis]
MSLPDLNTDEGRLAYRKELRRVAWPIRMAGFLLIVLGGLLALGARTNTLGLDNGVMPVAYAALALGWVLFLAAIIIRTRHHKRRLAEGL